MRLYAEVEDRLVTVIAQEEEVQVIANEHLEREVFLTKLLEDLYRKQKVGWLANYVTKGCNLRQQLIVRARSFCCGKGAVA